MTSTAIARREEPCGTGDDERCYQKNHGEAIGEARHRRLGALRCLNEAHDAGISAFSGPVCCEAMRLKVSPTFVDPLITGSPSLC